MASIRLAAVALLLTASIGITGCGDEAEERKAAACAAWQEFQAALDASNRTLGLPESEQKEIFSREFEAQARMKEAFAAAAKEDEGWADVQEAAYAAWSRDKYDEMRTVQAACDRLE